MKKSKYYQAFLLSLFSAKIRDLFLPLRQAGAVLQKRALIGAFLPFFAICFAAPGFAAAKQTQPAPAEPPACGSVRLAETGWTDIAVTTALTAEVLTALGYEPDVKMLSVPVTFSAMSTGEIDIFLGYWQPSMTADIKPYLQDGSIEIIRDNLSGARYGLAVPQYAYDAGLRSFADIARFESALQGKIYGVEPGNDANRILLGLIDADTDGLGKFTLVESSEQAMLSEAEAAIADKKPIVFLAWQPHPMNKRFKLAYLSGGEAYFGGGANGAAVATVIRKDYQRQCPNIGRFLQNLSFTAEQENTLMDMVLTESKEPEQAAKIWLKAHPDILAAWLAGVTDRRGAPALPAVVKALKLAP